MINETEAQGQAPNWKKVAATTKQLVDKAGPWVSLGWATYYALHGEYVHAATSLIPVVGLLLKKLKPKEK